ncbi:MAG: hypothetical protein WD972_02865 [Candidatus Andersenbacteria bacterium]
MDRKKESDQFPIEIHGIIRESGGSRSEALQRLQGRLVCEHTGNPFNTYDGVYVVAIKGGKRFVKPQALSDFLTDHSEAQALSPTAARRYIVKLLKLPAKVLDDGTIVRIAPQEQLVPV